MSRRCPPPPWRIKYIFFMMLGGGGGFPIIKGRALLCFLEGVGRVVE